MALSSKRRRFCLNFSRLEGSFASGGDQIKHRIDFDQIATLNVMACQHASNHAKRGINAESACCQPRKTRFRPNPRTAVALLSGADGATGHRKRMEGGVRGDFLNDLGQKAVPAIGVEPRPFAVGVHL